MRWFKRASVGLAVAICAGIAVPRGAVAAPREPEVLSVIEGRDGDGGPLVILVGVRMNALKELVVRADDGVRPPYNQPATRVVKSGKLAVWRLPDGIESDRGPDLYALDFTWGRGRELVVNARLGFGDAAPNSIPASALQAGSIGPASLSAGLRADLDDAVTLNGFGGSYYTDASNLDAGTLDVARFDAYDDLLNAARLGTASGQIAVGDHNHDALYSRLADLSTSDSAPNDADDPVDWSQLKNVPAVIAAGGHTAGDGLSLALGEFSVAFAGNGVAITAARSDHEHDARYFTEGELATTGGTLNSVLNPVDWSRLKSVPAGLIDGIDDDTTYTAGTGLGLSGTVFNVEYGGTGSATTASRSDHTHSGTYQPVFTAGDGIGLNSNVLSVLFGGNGGATTSARSDHDHTSTHYTKAELANTGVVNTLSNPVDWTRLKSVPASFADGTDADTTYSAGAGLNLSGTTFSVLFSGSGTDATAARSDHGHAGVYATEADLANAGGSINAASNPVDWSQLKNVPTGFSDGVDDGQAHTAGVGLTLSGSQFSVNFSGNGLANSASRADHNHDASYFTIAQTQSSGGTINLSSNPVDWTRLKSVPAGFTDGIDDDTTYTAGTGLSLSLGAFSANFGGDGVATTLSRSDHTHPSLASAVGTVNDASNPLHWSQLKGVPSGFADGMDDGQVYAAGTGLVDTANTFSVDFAGDGSASTAARSDHDHGSTFLKTDGTLTSGNVSLQSSGITINATTSSDIAVTEAAIRGISSARSYGVYGESTGTPGIGVFGLSSSAGGYGVGGQNDNATGFGVQGLSTQGIGVRGWTQSTTTKAGVLGEALATIGTAYGVHGKCSSTTGTGVYGESLSTLATGPAVRGSVQSANAVGVLGENPSTAGDSIGVKGTGRWGVHGVSSIAPGRGVYGESTASGTASFGVYGVSTSSLAAGVCGQGHPTSTTSGFGVKGLGRVGIHGTSSATDGQGVYGENTTTNGTDSYGVYGKAASNTSAGIYGEGPTSGSGLGVLGSGNTGVLGTSSVGHGVRGTATATTGVGRGVWGTTAASNGIGVQGEATHSTGINYGVFGRSVSTAGTGVLGDNLNTAGSTAYGVQGITESTTAAGVYGLGHSNNTTLGRGVLGRGATGVEGTTANTAGIGVYGIATATSGSTHGVFGSTDSAAGTGVLAECTRGGTNSAVLLVRHTDTGTTTGNLAVFKDQGSNVARIDRNGQGIFNGGTATSGADFAESVAVNAAKEEFEPGDVIVIDTQGRRRFALSSGKSSPLVAGIYSTRPGVLARPGDVANSDAWRDEEIPLAITGIVPCKVSDENGAVKAGDLLVSSSTPGYAMKAPQHPAAGTLVGKALEPMSGRRDKVEVLITMR